LFEKWLLLALVSALVLVSYYWYLLLCFLLSAGEGVREEGRGTGREKSAQRFGILDDRLVLPDVPALITGDLITDGERDILTITS